MKRNTKEKTCNRDATSEAKCSWETSVTSPKTKSMWWNQTWKIHETKMQQRVSRRFSKFSIEETQKLFINSFDFFVSNCLSPRHQGLLPIETSASLGAAKAQQRNVSNGLPRFLRDGKRKETHGTTQKKHFLKSWSLRYIKFILIMIIVILNTFWFFSGSKWRYISAHHCVTQGERQRKLVSPFVWFRCLFVIWFSLGFQKATSNIYLGLLRCCFLRTFLVFWGLPFCKHPFGGGFAVAGIL